MEHGQIQTKENASDKNHCELELYPHYKPRCSL